MYRTKWFFHPIVILIISIVALVTSLFLFIYWYMEVSAVLESALVRFNIDPVYLQESEPWVVVLVLSVLVGVILLGFLVIFAYNQKNSQLNRLQDNFINNFTHELKTPVTSLRLFLETMSKHELPRDDQLKYIRYMLSDVSRLSENISSILNLARIETRNYEGEFVQCELRRFLESFYEDNIHLFDACNVRIQKETDEKFHCRINPALFETLLMNIFTNAMKYNRSANPTLDIRFESGYRKLLVRFEDNGIGIRPSEVKKVFRKFYQSGSSDNMSARGSGLGLYMVQHIARLHHGSIRVESPGPDRGSVFMLQLPLSKS